MNQALVDQVAAAVLYEGYILYPYRPSVKNRQRWTFGGLYPRAYSEAQGGADAWAMQTECLVAGDTHSALAVRVRFLQLVERTVGELARPLTELPDGVEPAFRPVEVLEAGDRRWQSWQEAVEREVDLGESDLKDLLARPRRREFAFPPRRELEPVRGPGGEVVGVLVRRQQLIEGCVELVAERAGADLCKVTVRVLNQTLREDAGGKSRDEALMHSLVSTHTVLGVRGGAFVSLMDPPERWREAAAGCQNVGTWPVLVGEEGQKDTLLSSPIILYDYPRVAPESPGDLFDCTEIDEILTLRILTLTEAEKREAAAVDERARALLERTEALAREQLLGLHGAVRTLRPVREEKRHG
jgi:hydrogenase maturation protease